MWTVRRRSRIVDPLAQEESGRQRSNLPVDH
jgi:hypothetical protein